MVLITGKSTDSSANSGTSSSMINMKKSAHHDHTEVQFQNATSKFFGRNVSIRLKIQASGPICKARKRVSSLRLLDEKNEEGDFVEQFTKEGWPDDETCMWLSSGSSSPSCLFDDQILGNLLDLTFDDWLASFLISPTNSTAILSRATTFFDGSRVNPQEEASFVLDGTAYQEEMFEEDSIFEEEITAWLLNSLEGEDESADAVTTCSDCLEASSGCMYEDCRLYHDFFCHNGRDDGFPHVWETHKLGFFGSLIDLDGENSEWIADTELNFLQIDFPSPSYRSSLISDTQSSISNVSSNKENESISSAEYDAESEFTELADVRIDEPLFWQCEKKFDWTSEFSRDFLIMSPRKNICKSGKGNLHDRVRLAEHNAKIGLREEHKVWYNSRLELPNVLEPKFRSTSRNVMQTNTAAKLVSKSTTSSMSEASLDSERCENA